MIGDVRLNQQASGARCDDERRMSRRVANRRDGGDARRHLLVPLVFRHFARHHTHDAAHVLEIISQPAGARLMLPSSIQYATSCAGILISALGNAMPASAPTRPLIWSGCKWEITTMSIAFGSIPAATMLAWSWPAVFGPAAP